MQRRSTGILLALVAVFAMSAVAVSSASAAAPEFNTSSKKFPIPSHGESGAVTLATKVGDRQVKCQASKTTEEMGGFSEFKHVVIKLTGCKAEGPLFTAVACKSASGGGEEIITNDLTAKLRYIDEATKEVGLVFAPEAKEGLVAEIKCEDLGEQDTLKLRGAVIGRVTPVDTFAKTFKIEFAEAKGVQKPTEYEEGGKKVKGFLEMNGEGALETFAFEQSGLQAVDSLVWNEEVEVLT